jgi:hypothetical protein
MSQTRRRKESKMALLARICTSSLLVRFSSFVDELLLRRGEIQLTFDDDISKSPGLSARVCRPAWCGPFYMPRCCLVRFRSLGLRCHRPRYLTGASFRIGIRWLPRSSQSGSAFTQPPRRRIRPAASHSFILRFAPTGDPCCGHRHRWRPAAQSTHQVRRQSPLPSPILHPPSGGRAVASPGNQIRAPPPLSAQFTAPASALPSLERVRTAAATRVARVLPPRPRPPQRPHRRPTAPHLAAPRHPHGASHRDPLEALGRPPPLPRRPRFQGQ